MPAYPKVGIFLKKILAKELQAGRKDPAFIPYNSGDQILDAFKSQFESYTRQYPPFSARSQAWSQPIQYWTAMSQQEEASILAVILLLYSFRRYANENSVSGNQDIFYTSEFDGRRAHGFEIHSE
jgi:hypothetical protein